MKFYYRPNHPKASENGFVSEEDVGESEAPRALDAPIMVDRFYEGLSHTQDGKTFDIGSRKKHRDFMREHGLTTIDDFKGTWEKKAEQRRDVREHLKMPSKSRREVLARALYQKMKP
jgi:hypothetical protein